MESSSNAEELTGYLGKGSSDQYVRLYETVEMRRWIEVLRADIVDRSSVAGRGDLTKEWVVISVRREADVIWSELVPASNPYPAPAPPGGGRWPRP